MQRTDIPPGDLKVLPIDLWHRKWFLLSAGDFRPGDWNCMTVGWGGLGVMWNKPLRHDRGAADTLHRGSSWRSPAGSHSARSPRAPEEALLVRQSFREGREQGEGETGFTPIASRARRRSLFRRGGAHPGMPEDATSAIWIRPTSWTRRSKLTIRKKDYHRVYFGEIVGRLPAAPEWMRG